MENDDIQKRDPIQTKDKESPLRQIITFPGKQFSARVRCWFPAGNVYYLLHPLFTINGAAVGTAAPRAESCSTMLAFTAVIGRLGLDELLMTS
jgi:hypothetical protein